MGKLSDVVKAVQNVDMGSRGGTINSAVAVVDASGAGCILRTSVNFSSIR